MALQLVEARSLRVSRGAREVLGDVSLVLSAGQWTAIVGPNGAGKSSLLLGVGGPVHRDRRLDGGGLFLLRLIHKQA